MNDYRAYVECDYNSIYHYGVKGTKWGVRRYQYEDGSLTPEGVEHYKQLAAGAAGVVGVGVGAALAERRRNRLNAMAEKLSKARGTYSHDIARYNDRLNALQKSKKFIKSTKLKRQWTRDLSNNQSFYRYMKKTDPDMFKSAGRGRLALSKLSKKGKIGLAIGAAALAGAGGYALYKHNKKKKQRKET